MAEKPPKQSRCKGTNTEGNMISLLTSLVIYSISIRCPLARHCTGDLSHHGAQEAPIPTTSEARIWIFPWPWVQYIYWQITSLRVLTTACPFLLTPTSSCWLWSQRVSDANQYNPTQYGNETSSTMLQGQASPFFSLFILIFLLSGGFWKRPEWPQKLFSS